MAGIARSSSAVVKYPAFHDRQVFRYNSLICNNICNTKMISPHFRVIINCLRLWLRCSKSYQYLKDSGWLILPSGRLLSMYKNRLKQEPGTTQGFFIPHSLEPLLLFLTINLINYFISGLSDKHLEWMYDTAKSLNLPPHGYVGVLLADEITIQVYMHLKHEPNLSFSCSKCLYLTNCRIIMHLT